MYLRKILNFFRISNFPKINSKVWLWTTFLVSRALISVICREGGGDLTLYHKYAFKIFTGHVLFGKDLTPEYPPLAIWFMCLPGLINLRMRTFKILFRCMCFFIDAGMFQIIQRRHRSQFAESWVYLICTTLLGPLLYTRLDLTLGALVTVALYFLLENRISLFHTAVGFGIAFKLIPLVWAPAILAWEWKRPDRNLVRTCVLIGFPTVVSFAVVVFLGGTELKQLFLYHMQRGAEIESTIATIQIVLAKFLLLTTVKQNREFGAHDVHGPLENYFIAGSSALLVIIVLFGFVFCLRRSMTREFFALLLAWILSSAIVLSKVLSPQYLLFALPIFLILPRDENKTRSAFTFASLILAAGLTTIIFP